MRVKEILVGENNLGVVRTGATGARAELVKEGDQYFISFFSSHNRPKQCIRVKEGSHYVIGPNFVKERPAVENDRFWPRKWARLNGEAHKSLFRYLSPDNTYVYRDFLRGVEESCPCPEKLIRVFQNESSGSMQSWLEIYVNREWLKNATWEEFCWELDREGRENDLKYKIFPVVKAAIEDFKISAKEGDQLHCGVSWGSHALIYRGRVCYVSPGPGYMVIAAMSDAVNSLSFDLFCERSKLLKEKSVDEVLSAIKFNIVPAA